MTLLRKCAIHVEYWVIQSRERSKSKCYIPATYNNRNRNGERNEMKRNEIVSLSEGPNTWAKLINYHYGLLMVTDDGDY